MSILSAMRDNLHERADELREHADELSAPYVRIPTKAVVYLSMTSAATEMDRAADTIWELREKCGELQDERDELRELVRDMWDAALHSETFGDGSHLLMRMRECGIEADS